MITNNNSFTFLRLIGAFLVVFSHSYGLVNSTEPFEELTGIKASKVGLWIFFSLSGYLVSTSAIRSKGFIDFYVKRSLRIFPALVVLIIITTFVLGPLITSMPVSEYLLSNETISYLNNIKLYRAQYSLPGVFSNNPLSTVNGSLWTLCYEFSLYIAASSLIFFSKKHHIWIASTGLLFSVTMFIMGSMDDKLTIPFLYHNFYQMGQFATLFFLGALFKILNIEKHSFPGDWILCLLALISVVLLTPFSVKLILFAPLILFIGLKPSRLSGMDKFGDFSYGIYLYSVPIQQLIIEQFHLNEPTVIFFYSTVLSFVAGGISWFLIEKPALGLKRYSSTLNAIKLYK